MNYVNNENGIEQKDMENSVNFLLRVNYIIKDNQVLKDPWLMKLLKKEHDP